LLGWTERCIAELRWPLAQVLDEVCDVTAVKFFQPGRLLTNGAKALVA
jgi:hypothetical protein